MNDDALQELEAEHDQSLKKTKRLWNRILKEKSTRAVDVLRELFAETPTPKQVMALNWRTVEEAGTHKYPNEWYQAMQGWFLRFSGMRQEGCILVSEKPWVTQAGLQVMFDQNKPFEEQLDILKFARYIKSPMKGFGRGAPFRAKYINVFEHTLSYQRNIFIEFTTYPKTKLMAGDAYSQEILAQGTIRQVLRYVYEKHPYIRFGEDF